MVINFGQQAFIKAQQVIRRDLTPVCMDAGQVERGEYKAYDPETHDFQWNDVFTEVTIIPLRHWNDATYVASQTDCGDD